MASRLIAIAAVALMVAAGPAAAQFASDQDRREAMEHYRAGQELLSAEQFEKAVDAFQRAIDKDRFLTLAYYGQGQAYMALKRFASAIQAYTHCLEAHRELHRLQEVDRIRVERQRDEEIHELRDSVRRLRSGQLKRVSPTEADRLENRIHELERQRTSLTPAFQAPAELSLALGSAHFRNGQLPEAEQHWRTAIRANPSFGEARNNLAVILFLTGRLEEARGEITLAKKAGFIVDPRFEKDLTTAEQKARASR
jgi:tetratricopeptide (TPR) repeat protein